jgi:hypothetical protein
MIINVCLGFILPWIYGIYLYRKDPKIILLTCPMAAAIASSINLFGFYFEFWNLTPILRIEPISALPFDLGLYPVLGSCMIYSIRSSNINSTVLILIFSFLTTLMELIGVLFEKVTYSHGWNIAWTFVSYVIAYGGLYGYYRILDHHRVWNKEETNSGE